jgi:alpha-1,2-mannosyltransferase
VKLVRPVDLGVFGWAPGVFLAWLAWFANGHGGSGDFAIFRHAGRAVLSGRTLYVAPTVGLLSQNDHFVYPAPFAYPFVPFALLPERAGAVIYLVLSAGMVCAAVRLLGARDWRCYGAAFLTVPVFGALGVGSIGPLLLVLVAGGWRYRDRAGGGILVALAAGAKLFLWPLLVWLLVTRRFRASIAAAATLAATLGLWGLSDAHGLAEYPTTVRVLNEVERAHSYSLQTLALSFGASSAAAASVSAVLAVVGVGVIFGLRMRERDAFLAAVAVALLATPILWLHYLVLLLIPLLLFRSVLTGSWFILALLWATPHPESMGSRWRILLVLATIGVAFTPRLRWPERFLGRGDSSSVLRVGGSSPYEP